VARRLPVYSGVQQTREPPDRIAQTRSALPHLSTSRKIREGLFGLGANNASYFSIPINVPGGRGPNDGASEPWVETPFGGAAYYDFDFCPDQDTPFGRRSSGIELMICPSFAGVLSTCSHREHGSAGEYYPGSRLERFSRTAGDFPGKYSSL